MSWGDMDWYRAHEELPVFGFTPDADFPALCGEKGILKYKLTLPLSQTGLLSIDGGDAGNMVPAWCSAVIPGNDGPTAIHTKGVSAHASTPEKGENAISNMMELLTSRGISGPLVEFYNRHIGHDYTGGKMGCGFSDHESGHLTLNAGLIRTEGKNVILHLDIRSPVTIPAEEVETSLRTACASYGFSMERTEYMAPIYMDKNGKVIQAMMDIYRDVTGDNTQPKVIGGGTYARAMDGIVAFGPMQPGRECTEHEKDEYILLEDLFQAQEIYRLTIEKLANLE